MDAASTCLATWRTAAGTAALALRRCTTGRLARAVEEHPIVNLYCGGVLKATYGQASGTLSGFNMGSGNSKGLMWRVADVKASVDRGGNTIDCAVTASHPPRTSAGYYVTTDDTSF